MFLKGLPSVAPPIIGGGPPILGGTAGSVLFLGTGGVLQQDNTNFKWDDTNNILTALNLQVGDGAVGAPSIAFTSDPDTGFYWVSSGRIAFTANGTKKFEIDGVGGSISSLPIICSTVFGGTQAGRNDASPLTLTGGGAAATNGFTIGAATFTATSGTVLATKWSYTFAPTSGTAVLSVLDVNLTVNQTGGANGDVTLLKFNVTATAFGGTNLIAVDASDTDITHVLAVKADATDPTSGAVYGRMAVQVAGVGTKYVALYS